MLQKYEKKITYKYLWNKIKNADDNRYRKRKSLRKNMHWYGGRHAFRALLTNMLISPQRTNFQFSKKKLAV